MVTIQNVHYKAIPSCATILGLCAIIVFAFLLHLPYRNLLVASAAIALCFFLFRFTRAKTSNKPNSALVKVGFVFLIGAVYGPTQLARDGWRSVYLLAAIFPAILGSWLIYKGLTVKDTETRQS